MKKKAQVAAKKDISRSDVPKKPEMKNPLVGSEPHDVKRGNRSDVGKLPESINSSWGDEESKEMAAFVRFSGHSLRWAWTTDRQAQRGHYKANKMRNWEQRTWKCEPGIIPKNASIISKPGTLEVWIKAPRQADAGDMIHKAALRALRAAWAFAKWQGITIRLKKTAHPSDVQTAHIVLETERQDMKETFKREMAAGTSPRIGPVIDGSHAYKPEMTGPESGEGSIGLDWLTLEFKGELGRLRADMRLTMEGVLEIMRSIPK